jgi:hypothetical protein
MPLADVHSMCLVGTLHWVFEKYRNISFLICTLNPPYNVLMGGGSIIADFRHNQVKEYLRKHSIGYIPNTRNKRRNKQ